MLYFLLYSGIIRGISSDQVRKLFGTNQSLILILEHSFLNAKRANLVALVVESAFGICNWLHIYIPVHEAKRREDPTDNTESFPLLCNACCLNALTEDSFSSTYMRKRGQRRVFKWATTTTLSLLCPKSKRFPFKMP